MNTSTRDAHKLWDKKNIPQTGELGDVVGRPLPHGMLDTSEDPKSPDWCVPESFSICQSLPGGAWGGVRFRGDTTGLTVMAHGEKSNHPLSVLVYSHKIVIAH